MRNAEQELAKDGTVGRVAVAEYMGYSVKTLYREVERGNFPRPSRNSPGRVGWPLSVVKAERAKRDRHDSEKLEQSAVDNPDDLEPDELEDQARGLAAQALSTRTGKPVDASSRARSRPRQSTTATATGWRGAPSFNVQALASSTIMHPRPLVSLSRTWGRASTENGS